MRIESNKPTQLPIDSAFHFGASTRVYMLRERPQQASKPVMEELELAGEETHGELLGLPETETELDVSGTRRMARGRDGTTAATGTAPDVGGTGGTGLDVNGTR